MVSAEKSWHNLIEELRRIGERGSEYDNYFLTVRGLFERIPELVLYDDSLEPGVSLAHYTTWQNALSMFRKKQKNPVLRMYNYEQSNDPNEGKIMPPEWREIIQEGIDWAGEFLGDDWKKEMEFGGSTYGCSFSSGQTEIGDDLRYWRFYGNNGQGCSLKISQPQTISIYKARYRDRNFDSRTTPEKQEDEQVANRLAEFFETGKGVVDKSPDRHRSAVGKTIAEWLLRVTYGYCHLIKHKDFTDEAEWRMIRVMPPPREIRYDKTENLIRRYVNGPAFSEILRSASAITIGPAVINRGAARAYLEYLAKEVHNIDYVSVKSSVRIYRQSPSLKLKQG